MRVPQDCLSARRLAPHSFHSPEREELAALAHLDLRQALFFLATQHVGNVEAGLLRRRGPLSLERVRPADCADPAFAPNLADRLYKGKAETDELICCEEWQLRSGQDTKHYRLKYFQSVNDAFKVEAYPPTLRGYLLDYLANRHFRE